MKILIVAPGPRYSTYDVFKYYTAAFTALGHEVKTFNYHDWYAYYLQASALMKGVPAEDGSIQSLALRLSADRALISIVKSLPDLILSISGIALPAEMWDWINTFRGNSKKRIATAVLFTEAPYVDKWQLSILEEIDFGLLMEKASLTKYQAVNRNSIYVPHAYSEDMHYPRKRSGDYTADVFMVGTGFPERVDFLNSVDWHSIDLRLYGNWAASGKPAGDLERYTINRHLDNSEVPDWYSSSLSSLNIFRTVRWPGANLEHIGNAEAGSISPRCFEIMACGGVLFSDKRDELLEMFVPGKDFVLFDSPEDLRSKILYYKENPEEAERIRLNALESVKGNSYRNRASDIMSFVEARI